jgi:hypothetical protein
MRGVALVFMLALLFAGCSGEEAATTGAEPSTIAESTPPTVSAGQQTPTPMEQGSAPPPPTGQTPTGMEQGTTPPPSTPPAPPSASTPPLAAGHAAPGQRVRELRFSRVRLFPGRSGTFEGRANVTNLGRDLLTAIVFYWEVRDESGTLLDQGQLDRPRLAPGETITIRLTGTAPYRDDWRRVVWDWATAGA